MDVKEHYDRLIEENNDPVLDPKPLQDYMDRWDGPRFIQCLRLGPEKSVLEIGVGTGRLAMRTAPLCRSFYGIDCSPKTIERAAHHLAPWRHVRLICADFMAYDFQETFDVIYSSLTFMHIREKEIAIQKAADLLNPGGIFALSMDQNLAEYIDMGTRKVRIYPDDPKKIREHFLLAGFEILEEFKTEFAHIFIGTVQKA